MNCLALDVLLLFLLLVKLPHLQHISAGGESLSVRVHSFGGVGQIVTCGRGQESQNGNVRGQKLPDDTDLIQGFFFF